MRHLFIAIVLLTVQEAFAAEKERPILVLGSTNRVKYDSLKRVIGEYPFLTEAKLVSRPVSSGVSDQPMTLEETMRGAMNRAKSAFYQCDLSVGIESGLMVIKKGLETLYFDITVCSVFDGKKHHFGLSCSFQLPSCVTSLIHQQGMVLGDAMRVSGLTSKVELGKEEGSIGVLSFGRVSRQDYTEQAIKMALIPIENAAIYQSEEIVYTDKKPLQAKR